MKFSDLGDKGPDFIREMDSQGYRGSRNSAEDDAGKKEYRGKAAKPGDVVKQGAKALDNAFNHKEDDWSAEFERRMKKGVEEADESRYRFIRHNIWTVMDGDEEVMQHPVEGDPFFSAKKFMRDLDDEGYEFTHVVSPEGQVTYLPQFDPRNFPKDDVDESVATEMTPNWAKYVLDQIYNSDGAVTLTDLFDEGIPGLHAMFMATAEAHGLDPEEEFEDVQHELTVELEDLIKGGHGLDEASLAQMRDYFNQTDSDSVKVNRNYDAPNNKKNPVGIPQEIQTLVNKMYHAGKITPEEFETLRKFQQQTKINVGIREADKNPYAIGMAQAMKSTGDKPPLKKSTINKAHEIARAIKKGD